MDLWRDFHGANAAYALELYERYCRDPRSVDEAARAYFAHWTPPREEALVAGHPLPSDVVVGAVHLAQAIRAFGHLVANLDPLGSPRPGDPLLDPAAHGVSESILRRLPAGLIGGPFAERAAHAWEAIERLRERYCSTIGFDYEHIHNPDERFWLRLTAETYAYRAPYNPLDEVELLERLTRVEVMERFLHRVFPGKFRFSIEGLDMMVPMLDELISLAVDTGIRQVLMGMAHRGRLNVLAHVLQKPYAEILAEFKDPVQRTMITSGEDMGYTGDVKYHRGKSRLVSNGELVAMQVWLAPNPSHLEAVNPVVEGMARAAGTRVDAPGEPRFDHLAALPVLIHGDAAFTGQGVVAETLNFSRLEAYRTGGTIHIIANNQLGFTTEPADSRSTLYASDLAKGFEIPIVHVNADDPAACIEAIRLAFDYRARFQKDFLIDLIGYRRHGHNEGDEPGFTQPALYEKIERHPTVRKLWADELVARGVIDPEEPARLEAQVEQELQAIYEQLEPEKHYTEPQAPRPPRGLARRTATAVPAERLIALADALGRLPEDFTPHPKLRRVLERRATALADPDQPTIDWAVAEALAFASILEEGIAIRLTGQDVERGTFSQRHAVLTDVRTGRKFIPLQHLPQARAAFEIHNSALTENAALGFEYGYNIHEPARMVLWEAQYGDFINGAQVMLDEFIFSARAKWGLTPSLTMLLPHGYEGQGPDHSSARIERFLQSAADINLRLVYPTTTAQYFHVLRRQALLLTSDPLPLVVLTPKSLLRNAASYSRPRDLAEGRWEPVIDDLRARRDPSVVRRLLLCSGKIYVDLTAAEPARTAAHVAIARVEQIYPLPWDDLRALIEGYPNLEELIWVQEEPENMGVWRYIQPHLMRLGAGRWSVQYLGRPESSSPAEGSAAWHAVNQAAIVEQAFLSECRIDDRDVVWMKMS